MKSKIRNIGRVMWQFQWDKAGLKITNAKGHCYYLWFYFGPCEWSDVRLYCAVLGPAVFSFSILKK